MKTLKFVAAICILSLTATAFGDSATGTSSDVIEWGTFDSGGVPTAVTSGPATIYPSEIMISGLNAGEEIDSVEISLFGGAHTFADDLEIALSYNGQVLHVMNEAGGADDVAGDLTFMDGAAPIDDLTGTFPGSGTFGISDYGVSVNVPASNITSFADFSGDGNGTWGLWVYDDAGGDTGSFSQGWSIAVNTSVVPEPATASLLLTCLMGLIGFARRR